MTDLPKKLGGIFELNFNTNDQLIDKEVQINDIESIIEPKKSNEAQNKKDPDSLKQQSSNNNGTDSSSASDESNRDDKNRSIGSSEGPGSSGGSGGSSGPGGSSGSGGSGGPGGSSGSGGSSGPGGSSGSGGPGGPGGPGGSSGPGGSGGPGGPGGPEEPPIPFGATPVCLKEGHPGIPPGNAFDPPPEAIVNAALEAAPLPNAGGRLGPMSMIPPPCQEGYHYGIPSIIGKGPDTSAKHYNLLQERLNYKASHHQMGIGSDFTQENIMEETSDNQTFVNEQEIEDVLSKYNVTYTFEDMDDSDNRYRARSLSRTYRKSTAAGGRNTNDHRTQFLTILDNSAEFNKFADFARECLAGDLINYIQEYETLKRKVIEEFDSLRQSNKKTKSLLFGSTSFITASSQGNSNQSVTGSENQVQDFNLSRSTLGESSAGHSETVTNFLETLPISLTIFDAIETLYPKVEIYPTSQVPDAANPFYEFFAQTFINPSSDLQINLHKLYIDEIMLNFGLGEFTIGLFDDSRDEVLDLLYFGVFPLYLEKLDAIKAQFIKSQVKLHNS
ncbi:hypothetical protein BB561_001166 [Smittium simulii]|uniref:RGS domain-containing protein n=1 Tax=Smittium simulii TaxID=133385 RepID=A0A2T9YVX3_9FUNG|nr:hypothetical protein BB561_001166 [Smittium simulii]